MALTSGERKTITTASSVSNRMGVVPAYGGDALSTFLKTATEKTDFFAQRLVTLEENKWKADAQLTTTKAINDFARKHWDNPSDFVKNTDAYVDSLIQKAPKRYQSWIKSFAGLKAASKGELISNQREALDFQEAHKANELSTIAFHDDASELMYDMPLEKIDEYKKSNYDVELGEIYKRYSETYYIAKASERSQMQPPKEWLRKQQISFELLRVNNKIKHLVDDSMRVIREEEYSVGFDTLKQLNTDIASMLNDKYMKNPDMYDTDGAATLIGSTQEERAMIVKEATDFLSKEISLNQKEVNAYELTTNSENKMQHTKDMFQFMNEPEDHLNKSTEQLQFDAVNLGLNQDGIDNYVAQYHLGQKINQFAQSYLPNAVGEFDTTKNLNMVATDLYNVLNMSELGLLNQIEGSDVVGKLKNLMINQNLKSILDLEEIRDLEIGKFDIYERNENGDFMLNQNGQKIENKKFAVLTAFAMNIGEPIQQVTNYLNSIYSVNVESENGLNQLDKAAYMVNYFKTKDNGYAFVFRNVDKELLEPLKEYHELRQLNTGDIQREVIAKDFFSKMNLSNTDKGKIKIELNKLIKSDEDDMTGSIDLTAIINKQLSTGSAFNQTHRYMQKEGTGGYRSYVTGDKFINNITGLIFTDMDEAIKIDNNKVQKIIRPILDLYLTQSYLEDTEITTQNLTKKIHTVLNDVLDNFQEDGMYWSAY
tara:strand:- start:309 stop:2438 length:2130 start_codon:yes stop_codon:yes gene_type:complete